MLLAFTLGFDEKFAIRSLIRRKAGKADEVVVILPFGRVDERTNKALASLNHFLTTYLNASEAAKKPVESEDFYTAVADLAAFFRQTATRPIILNLSGGMRMLIIEAFVGAVVSQVPITVEVESEDGSNFVEFDTSITKPLDLDDLDREILNVVFRGPTTLTILSQVAGVSRPTVWRRLKKMRENEVIEVTELEKGGIKCMPTPKSKIYFELLSRLVR